MSKPEVDMSDKPRVVRYAIGIPCFCNSDMKPFELGSWVRYLDYLRLANRVEELEKEKHTSGSIGQDGMDVVTNSPDRHWKRVQV